MARGSPDWYRGFDAFGGGVRLSVRPAYGGCQRLVLAATVPGVPAGETKALGEVSGQGIIHGGWIYLDTTEDHKDDVIILAIDGAAFASLTFSQAHLRNIGVPFAGPIWCGVVDEILFNYCMHVSPGFTFDVSVEVKYTNAGASTVAPGGILYYAVAP